MTKRLTMTVTMQVTPPQALALKAMFDYWNQLSSQGSSRVVGFYVDGDGNFHPKCIVRFTGATVPELTDELRKLAVLVDKEGDRTYDFDAIAWKINHPEQKEEATPADRQWAAAEATRFSDKMICGVSPDQLNEATKDD